MNLCEQDIKTEMNPVLNPRAAGPEGSLIGIPGILKLINPVIFINLYPSSKMVDLITLGFLCLFSC